MKSILPLWHLAFLHRPPVIRHGLINIRCLMKKSLVILGEGVWENSLALDIEMSSRTVSPSLHQGPLLVRNEACASEV